MAGVSVKEAAKQLGLSNGQVRLMVRKGELKGRQIKASRGPGYEWRVYLNGKETTTSAPAKGDPLTTIGDELISLGRRLKAAIKEHDEVVRRDTIAELGSSLVETANKKR